MLPYDLLLLFPEKIEHDFELGLPCSPCFCLVSPTLPLNFAFVFQLQNLNGSRNIGAQS